MKSLLWKSKRGMNQCHLSLSYPPFVKFAIHSQLTSVPSAISLPPFLKISRNAIGSDQHGKLRGFFEHRTISPYELRAKACVIFPEQL
jgi:hypothetical protein